MTWIAKNLEIHDSCAGRSWYALYTRHQHEKSAAEALLRKGHEVFLPLYSVMHRWRDRSKRLSLPLFPSYVFIRTRWDRRLEILDTPGIISIVGCSGRPEIVSEEQIDAVRRIVASPVSVDPYPFLQYGERVIVTDGPLIGMEGILVRKKGISRFVVSLEMLGRSAAVEIDLSSIERVGPIPLAMRRYSIPA